MNKIKVKICCISSLEEAKLAINKGASAIGLVSEMPSGPGVISEEIISEIAKSVPSEINTFLLTSKQDTKSIIEQLKRCRTNTVQIVDKLVNGHYSDIRNELPNVKIVQVIHVNGEESIIEAQNIRKFVDAILLDSDNQKLDVKVLGGTGKTHNWSISKKIVESVNIPVYLAGGLGPDNIINAINEVNPYGVDLCTRVRTNDQLDEIKMKQLFSQINTINK